MDEELRELLDAEIRAGFEEIRNSAGDNRGYAIDDLVKLYKLKTDEANSEREADERNCFAEHQAKERYVRLALDAAGIVLPLIFYGVWMRRGLKFEESGNFTSTTFRGLINRFKPTKQ